MGALSDAAKKNSNFLKLEKGEVVICTYLSARLIPSTMDPTKETVQYKLGTEHGDKFWTNGNSRIMQIMDKIEPGTKIMIERKPWINADKTEDTSKSMYEVSVTN